jgi:transposase
MDEQQTVDQRPGGALRPPEPGRAASGRSGWMSRKRKSTAVLPLLRGEDLETVSRRLGVTAATLSTWRDGFLAAGEAALTAKPSRGEERASERLKAKLGEALIERTCCRRRLPSWWPTPLGPSEAQAMSRTVSPISGEPMVWLRSAGSGASPTRGAIAIRHRRPQRSRAGVDQPDRWLMLRCLKPSAP